MVDGIAVPDGKDNQRRVALSVVGPCYNEQDGVKEFVDRAAKACANLVGDAYEIVLIDDGSKDGTWETMQWLAASRPCVVAGKLSRNFGHQLAVTAGLSLAMGERVLIIDTDLQDPPELIGDMMAQMASEKADVVYGVRRQRKEEATFKKMTAALFYRVLNRLTDLSIPLDTGDFRLMSRRVVDHLQAMPENQRFVRGMVTWVGFKQVPIYYDRAGRFAGTTKYPLVKMLRFALDAITGFSISPLRIASIVGFSVAALSTVLFLYAFVQWMLGDTVQGWTSLIATTLMLSSMQMIMLGIMGEYVGRIFVEVKRRPLFLIETVLRHRPEEAPPRHGSETKVLEHV